VVGSGAYGLLALSLIGSIPRAEDKPAVLVVEAWIATAGPYGESWDLRLTPSGEASLRVNYMSAPSGSLMARFSLSADQLAAIRHAIASERFFELPAKVSPAPLPLHRPALRLDIWLDEKHHSVQLYDPDQQRTVLSVRRFLAVWRRVFAALPIRPSWGEPRNDQSQPTRPG
jgi:hypothetical protein